ncbi:MAG: HAD-IA family hydrolase [Lachnospiraceae bacterium]|nr:HAD-IA family hydrolase [Lachnospiraceae bacterium]
MGTDNKIKGIFFDFDGVITIEKNGTPTMVAYISEKMELPFDKVNAEYRKFNNDLLLGNITHRDMWEQFCNAVGKDISYSVLEESFLNITLDQHMIKLIRELKEKYYIGMITDNKADRIEAVINNTELKDLFDFVVISANVHSQKTEEAIFKYVLKESGFKADECIFIDNTGENLKIPDKMGFKTILFDDANRNYEEVEKKVLG